MYPGSAFSSPYRPSSELGVALSVDERVSTRAGAELSISSALVTDAVLGTTELRYAIAQRASALDPVWSSR